MFNIFRRSASQPKQQQPPKQQQDQNKQIKTPYPPITQSQVRLPDNFAEKLLNLELEIESPDLTIETVTELLNLYREGVEYFEAMQNQKYLVFKNKIQQLLTKKNVSQIMKAQCGGQKKKEQNSEQKQSQLEEDQKQKELQIRLNYIRSSDQKKSVNNLMAEHTEKSQKINEMIDQEISGQKESFQQRLQKRRESSVKKQGQSYVISRTNSEFVQNKFNEESPGPKEFKFDAHHTPQIRKQNTQSYSDFQTKYFSQK